MSKEPAIMECKCYIVRNILIVLIFNALKFFTGVYFSFTSMLIAELKLGLAKKYAIEQSWINFYSSYCYTGPLGVLIFTFIVQRFGNKPSLLYTSLAYTFGFLLIGSLNHTASLIISQIIVGLGISVMLSQGINYIGEMTEGSGSRSIFMIASSLCVVFGGLYQSLIAAYVFPVSDGLGATNENWRNIAWLHMITLFVITYLVFAFIPESIVWLLNGERKAKENGNMPLNDTYFLLQCVTMKNVPSLSIDIFTNIFGGVNNLTVTVVTMMMMETRIVPE